MDRAAQRALNEFAKTIGMVTIKYNEAQAAVLVIFVLLSDLNRDVARTLFFSVKSDAGQRDMTIALANTKLAETHPEDRRNVVAAIENLSSLSGERNAAIHTMWYLDESFPVKPTSKKKQWVIPDRNSVPHRKLQTDALSQFKELVGKLEKARILLMFNALKVSLLQHPE